MAGVELHGAELFRVSSAGMHEGNRPVDLARQPLIALPGRAAGHEVLVPGMDLAKVGVPAAGEGPAHVQRDRRAVIRVQQPARVRRPGPGGELDPVHRVAPVHGKLHAVPDFGQRRPGLGELARHPADLDHRHAGRIRQHDGHLQQRPELAPDAVSGRAGERLRTVAALQQERLPARHRRQPLPQLVALPREHQRRQVLQPAHHRLKPAPVRPLRLLNSHRPPGTPSRPGTTGRAHPSPGPGPDPGRTHRSRLAVRPGRTRQHFRGKPRQLRHEQRPAGGMRGEP